MNEDDALDHDPPARALARGEAMRRDAESAAAPGASAGQREARQRVARMFFEAHCPLRPDAALSAYLAGIDWAQPVQVVNLAGKTEQDLAPKRGFLGLGARREQYLPGERFAPAGPDDPAYALKSTPLKRG